MSRVDAKVVLLGKSFVGKTCLVNRYVHQRFDASIPYQNTIGAAFGSKREHVGGKSIVLGIWDTAGHERYESMTRMYYRGAVACILCYDLTDKSSFDRARFWAGELRATEEHCMIYLCGTKKDIVDDHPSQREVDRKMAEPLAADFQSRLFETSSNTGENIDELFKTIAGDIIQKREAEEKVVREQRGCIELTNNESGTSGCFLSKCVVI
ncbi:Ras-related protein Rab-24 [Mactra antiquata]